MATPTPRVYRPRAGIWAPPGGTNRHLGGTQRELGATQRTKLSEFPTHKNLGTGCGNGECVVKHGYDAVRESSYQQTMSHDTNGGQKGKGRAMGNGLETYWSEWGPSDGTELVFVC